MAENDLTITLRAVDEASLPIRNAMNGVRQSATDAGQSIQKQFKEAGKELHEFRKTILIVSVAFAAMVGAVKEASKYNQEAKTNFDKFTASISSLAATIGTALAPALNGATILVNFLRDTIDGAIAGFIKLFSLIFESFGAIASGMQNVVANIKNIFTGKEDPMGIVEGFKVSFGKAMAISNAAADEFLAKIETTRAAAESGTTLESLDKAAAVRSEREKADQEKIKKGWDAAKSSVKDFGTALTAASSINKTFAISAAAVAIGMAIINTATGVTAALAGPPTGPPWPINLGMAALVAATGAIQIATIASQSFAVGTGNVPSDMTAQIHAGETIVPATFADAIRQGELSLSGPGSGGGGDITINLFGVTINSKDSIRSLAEELGFEIDRNLRNARTAV